MDLITTHVNADFDALGSLVAAKKLYPESRLLLPGSQEQAVREFLSLAKEAIIVESEKECSLDGIDRLILVDTRQPSRIGIAAKLLDKGVEVHVYDHHPPMKGDVVADKDTSEEVGSTITILADMIKRKHIKLSYLEATIMLLGIYEETGSLTYRTTTNLDVDMVSFLLSQGASLSMVSSYINRELTEAELSLLTRLINSTERVTVNGIHVSMIELSGGDYVGELGMLIHKLLDVENIPVLFVLLDNSGHGRVDIIARSKIPSVDVNRVLASFGGGGHPSAAAAKVRSHDAGAVKEKLIKVLKRNIKLKICALDIMSRETESVRPASRVDDTKQALLKARTSGLPVVDRGRIAGIITFGMLNKAIRRGYGHSKVKGYMSSSFVTVKPETPLHEIHRIMLKDNIGILPVVKYGKMVGIINRTDVLRSVHASLYSGPKVVEKKVVVNLAKKMDQCFPKKVTTVLKHIGRLANSFGYTAFVVGGLVRDLLLGCKNLDLDIVIEPNAMDFGRILSKDLGGTLVVHKKFGTCTVFMKNGMKIDLATARKETYEKPAALPTVEFSSLKNDLIRRDFTINAMAASLNKENFGQLIDFFGGEADLARGRIRALHDKSFIDDPTRIFRAVRFEQRLGFAVEKHTEELILGAVEKEMIEKVQPQRIRDEIMLILQEEGALKALKRMAELHELKFIHHDLKLDRKMVELYGSIDMTCRGYGSLPGKGPAERWLIYLMALLEQLSHKEIASICREFVFRKSDTMRILSYKRYGKAAARALAGNARMRPSEVYKILNKLSDEAMMLLLASATSKLAKARIKDFIGKHSLVRIAVKGDDIKALGLKPGPKFKKILDKVLHKKIDGELRTRTDELKFIKTEIS
jgi:tRNA nucleotidyltransferase (CCA-adding enzyme)